MRLHLHKIFHWEYWPMYVIYAPLMPIWFYYSIRARSLFFFSSSNPTFKNGGMAMESKKEIYDIIPPEFIPKTNIILDSDSSKLILSKIEKTGLQFPMIVKPDIGMKAFAVTIVNNIAELLQYKSHLSSPFLIQELITYPKEIGIFYYRYPDQKHGVISGLVEKEFLYVEGNGRDHMRTLITENPRGAMKLKAMEKLHGTKLGDVLALGEKFILVPYGSHTRGAKFIDVTKDLNSDLLKSIDEICNNVAGFFYGRLDIRYNTFSELCLGQKFSIIEINGAGSEPTHIYDPGHSIFYAWREITKHWKILFRISKMNKLKGHSYISFSQGMKMLSQNRQLELKLKSI